MTAELRAQVADYLAVRRVLGYRLARPEKLLGQFADYLEQIGQSRITVAAALDWARQPDAADSNWWAYRLSVMRGFATWAHTIDPFHQVPTADLLPQRPRRATPFLYSGADIAAMIAATGTLRTPLRRATYATLLGLLAVTGMRAGEAINLARVDVGLCARAGCWSATPSPARVGNCCCTQRPWPRFTTTPGCVPGPRWQLRRRRS